MTPGWDQGGGLLRGPLLRKARSLPLGLCATLCDLRPRFLPKGRVGRGYRAMARNGRVLLASRLPLAELAGHAARLRLQPWNRAVLPGDVPEPYGLLLCLDTGRRPAPGPIYETRLEPVEGEPAELCLDVGGRLALAFRLPATEPALRTATNR